MEANTLIDFWRSIFCVVREKQEQGIQVKYQDVISETLGLNNGRFYSIPDLIGVDITDDLVYEFLRQSMASKEERHEAELFQITQPGEGWKQIPGFSRYMVSSLGRVWSCYHGKLLKPQEKGNRYLTVNIYSDEGIVVRRYVHRLVAQAFIPNPCGYSSVDHIDEDHFNNKVDNLRWMTPKMNLESYMRNHGYWYNPDAWHPGKEPKRYPCPADTEEERWMNVMDYPDYFVSDQGRVWSIFSGEMKTSNGYAHMLSGGRFTNRPVRRLVAAAFLPPKKERQVLRHKNGDKTDLRACNLYWTYQYVPKGGSKRGRPRKDTGIGRVNPSFQGPEGQSPTFLHENAKFEGF